MVPILLSVALVGCGDDASTADPATATPEPATLQAPANPRGPQATIPVVATPDTVTTPVTTPAPTAQPTVAPTKPSAKHPPSPEPATDLKVAELVAANSAFSVDLYREIADADGNGIFSPHSISLALAMTYAGAAGDTRNQMERVLGFDALLERVHPAFHDLHSHLDSGGEETAGGESKGFRLSVANAVWGQRGRDYLAPFVGELARHYGAGLMEADFAGAPEPSRSRINAWVGDQTEQRITDLIAPGVVNSATRLVLANAVYFKAAWHLPFDKDDTSPLPFHLLDGREVDVPMMRRLGKFGYARGDGVQAVELLYEGHQMAMVILLPDEGQFELFESALDVELVHQALSGLEMRQVLLTMPRFEIDAGFNLSTILAEMGMPTAFNGGAVDFSAMDGKSCALTPRDCLSISDVVHRAFISVDEEGTEATAATAVVAGITRAVDPPPEPVALTIDRPFIFLIHHRETGAILFLGRVMQP